MGLRQSRRAFVGAAGTAALSTVAGCSSVLGGSPGGGSSPASSSGLRLPSVVTAGDLPDGRVPLVKDGRVSLVNFFTTWCKPCRREMPDFRKLRAEYGADTLHMVSVTPEVDEELIRSFWEEYDGTWPVLTDSSLAATSKYGANSYPTNLLFDRAGEPASGGDPEVQARTYEEFAGEIDSLLE